ncbi:MAG: hypothetical protein QNJ00_06930 [Woeseiaceae bacterium]|nr:hypothetical protein [Woeseiaceae bacterium]
MNSELGNGKEVEDNDDDLESNEGSEDTIVINTEDDDELDVGIATEVNVEELVAKLDATDENDVARKRAIKKRLEELDEVRSADLDSTYNFNLDDDL